MSSSPAKCCAPASPCSGMDKNSFPQGFDPLDKDHRIFRGDDASGMDDSYQRSVRLEIVERLETVIAAILRLAGCRTVTRLLPSARRVATRTGDIRRLGAVTMQCADIDTACLADLAYLA